MSRRRDGGDPEGDGFVHAPFRELVRLVKLDPKPSPPAAASRPAPAPANPAKPPAPDPSDEDLFRSAVAGTVPIPPEERGRAPEPSRRPAPTSRSREDAEALALLSDLVSGTGTFDVSDGDEHVEGAVVGLDPRLLRRLRAGDFACQAHLDLHGMTAEEAKGAVRGFLLRALRAGHRCVLLVHGRGRNSPDQRAVLKEGLKTWLTRGELARIVLAFSTARACDGGAGATYVLLRRERRNKRPFQTLDGAKR